MVRLIGSGRAVMGDEASERLIKTADLGRYRILHFAVHAVVDEREPQRSAVVLAPGDPQEDGLLQMREIVDLDLDETLVIISACQSAAGEITGAEGVAGLARAFFQAGARTVIGGLWTLRDQETAEFVADVARRLGRGDSVGEAVAAVRRVRIDAGSPVAAWASLIVIGDSDLRPVTRPAPSAGDRTLLAIAGGAVLLGLAGLLTWRLRHPH